MNSIDIVKNLEEKPWAITPETLIELDYRLHELQPKTILECGSGLSTLIFARYAKQNPGVRVVTLEHDPKYFKETKKLLGKYESRVDVVRCDLIGEFPIYDVDLIKYPEFDFVLIDGPPSGTGGRRRIFDWIADSLSEACEVWLDDGDRPDEIKAVDIWEERYSLTVRPTKLRKGLTILTFYSRTQYRPDMSDVAVTMLSGRRPDLLEKTLKSLPLYVLDGMLCLVNGGDEDSCNVCERYCVDYITTEELLPTGKATSMLAKYALDSGKRYWLAFQDDWEFVTLDEHWLDRAKEMLESSFLVRLRHFSDKVLDRNLYTKKRYALSKVKHGLMGNMHWTFNPTLQECDMIPNVYPCEGERESMKKAVETGMGDTSQLYPGCCKHIGGKDSLLDKVGRKTHG